MPSIAPPRFEWHDLPSTPHDKNRSFAIYTPQIELQQDIVLPDLAVTWAESPKYVRDVERVKESLQGYKLRHHEKAGQGRLFYYGKVLTEEERGTPFLEWPVRRMHFWPTVLLKLWFEQTNAVPLSGPNADGSIATTPRLLDRAKYRDGDSYPTTFIIRQYLSDEPWPSSRFKTILPMTDSVRWNFLSNQGSFPECLHPKCTFHRQRAVWRWHGEFRDRRRYCRARVSRDSNGRLGKVRCRSLDEPRPRTVVLRGNYRPATH